MLLAQESRSGVDVLFDLTRRLEKRGEQVTSVNPLATRDATLDLSLEIRQQIVDAAFRSLHEEQGHAGLDH